MVRIVQSVPKEPTVIARISTSEARKRFADIVNEVHYGKRRVELVRRGKTLCGLVPADDLRRLQELEDRTDAATVARAMKNHTAKRTRWASYKAEVESKR